MRLFRELPCGPAALCRALFACLDGRFDDPPTRLLFRDLPAFNSRLTRRLTGSDSAASVPPGSDRSSGVQRSK
tara:strand:+ start:199 stop:417 length:219 start_codon:yes stop_codon:yes gene_type:complete